MKLILLLLSGFKYLKFGKLLATGGTMLLSVAAYALVFGWRYAAGFVLLLLLHEMALHRGAPARPGCGCPGIHSLRGRLDPAQGHAA